MIVLDCDFCLAYECPLPDVTDEDLYVCSELGYYCDSCDHRCPTNYVRLP